MSANTFFDPGALNHRVTIESILETPDGCGGTTITWAAVAKVWASIQPFKARSSELAQQLSESVTHTMSMRYREDVSSGWRLTMGNRHFALVTVYDPDERKRYLVCEAQEEGR